MQVFYLR